MTAFLAKFLGIYFVVVSIAMFFQPARFRKMYKDLKGNDPLLIYGGIISTLFGAFIVTIHNIWVFDWPVIMTLVGWLGLLKGIGLMASPNFSKLFSFLQNKSDRFYRLIGGVWAIMGLFLLYQGM